MRNFRLSRHLWVMTLLASCFQPSSTGPDGGAPPGPKTDGGTAPIPGSDAGGAGSKDAGVQGEADGGAVPSKFTVHVRGPGASAVQFHVMLGTDPSTSNQGKAVQGDISFPGVLPPQDVTVIAVRDGRTSVTTLRGATKSEVTVLWIGTPSGGTGIVKGTLTQLTAGADDRQITAHFLPRGRERPKVSAAGDFSLETRYQGDFWIAGYEGRGSGIFAQPLRAGINRFGLTLPAGGKVDPANVALTHPFDQSMQVKIDNTSDFPGAFFGGAVTYNFAIGPFATQLLFPALGIFGGATGSLPAVARTAPFDDCTYGAVVGTQGQKGETTLGIRNGIASLGEKPEEFTLLPMALLEAASPQAPASVSFKWSAPRVGSAEVLLLTDGSKGSLDPGESFLNSSGTFSWLVLNPPTGAPAEFKPMKLPKVSGAPELLPAASGPCSSAAKPGCYQAFLFAVDHPLIGFDQVQDGKLDPTRIAEQASVRVSMVVAKVEVR